MIPTMASLNMHQCQYTNGQLLFFPKRSLPSNLLSGGKAQDVSLIYDVHIEDKGQKIKVNAPCYHS